MTMHTEGPWSAAAMTPTETAAILRQFNTRVKPRRVAASAWMNS